MAIYHLSVKTISRSAGRSATAAIAYRAGELIVDQRTGLAHDYRRRSGIEHTEIFLPENSPAWANDRSQLWNAAEMTETRKNSTVAREFELAIPAELDKAQRLELVREFARDLVQRHGMAVDVAIHTPGREGDDRNHHAHVLCSTRRLTAEGFTEKTRELDNQMSGEVIHWRQRWAEVSNHYLEKSGSQERIDHRSLEAQRTDALVRGDAEQATKLDRIPTVHLGPNVVQMERRGKPTNRGEVGREIAKANGQIIDFAEARKRLEERKVDHERNNRERPYQGLDGGAGRVDAKQPERGPDKRHVGRVGQVPPAFARGRLRNLSELSVVRFPERGEVLLPRDVPGVVEHQRAESDHALRRDRDGLNPAPAATGKQPAPRAQHPEKIKMEWQAEKSRQFGLVADKARRVQDLAAGQLKRQEGRLAAHDKTRPQEPTGLFAGMKKAAHEQALGAWRTVRAGLEKRWSQLQNRVHQVADYMRKAPHEFYASKGERLAERKAAQARPDLAAQFKDVTAKEKNAAMAAQREKIEQRQRGKNDSLEKSSQARGAKTMKTEPTANPLSSDPNVHAALAKARDAKELQQLERDGRSVEAMDKHEAEQKQNVGQPPKGLDAKAVGEKSKEVLKREILERFKRDRDNDRGRGR